MLINKIESVHLFLYYGVSCLSRGCTVCELGIDVTLFKRVNKYQYVHCIEREKLDATLCSLFVSS